MSKGSATGLLIEVFLEAGENHANLFGPAEVGNGISERIVVLEPEERRQFLPVQLLHAFFYVVGENEVEKRPLFVAERKRSSSMWSMISRRL